MKKINLLKHRGKLYNSIYSVLLIYFLIVLIFMSVVFLLLNQNSRDEVRKENIRVLAERTRNYFKFFEDDLENLVILQQEYINDPSLKQLSGRSSIMTPYEKSEAVKDVEHRLSWLTSYSDIIEESSVYISGLERIVSANKNIEEVDDETREFLCKSASYIDRRIIGWKDKVYIIFPYPKLGYKVSPKFILFLEISESWISKQLSQFTELPNSTVALFHKELDLMIKSYEATLEDDEVHKLGKYLMGLESESGEISWGANDQYVVVYQYSNALDMMMYVYFLEDTVVGGITENRNYIIKFAIAMIVVLAFYTLMVFSVINKPMNQIVNGLRQIEKGNLDVQIQSTRSDEFGYMIKRFNRMCERLKNTIQQVYEERIHVQQAEMKQLQYQINPHFLYNSLYMIRRMALNKDYENIDTMSRHLARYYEYITRSGANKINLKKEMNHAVDYLNIQSMRFQGRVTTEVEPLPDRWDECIVPRLILQPVLENTYNHGVESMVEGAMIKIKFKEEDELLYINIMDNGDVSGDKLEEINSIIHQPFNSKIKLSGLVNVHRRLRIMYGERCCLSIAKKEETGETVVTIVISRENIMA